MRRERRRTNNAEKEMMSKLGLIFGRFGDHLCVDCANLPHVVGSAINVDTKTKFTIRSTQISKCNDMPIGRKPVCAKFEKGSLFLIYSKD